MKKVTNMPSNDVDFPDHPVHIIEDVDKDIRTAETIDDIKKILRHFDETLNMHEEYIAELGNLSEKIDDIKDDIENTRVNVGEIQHEMDEIRNEIDLLASRD